MNDFQIFRDEIERIRDDMDTLLYLLDNRQNPKKKISDILMAYESEPAELSEALQTLKRKEGDTLLKDIDMNFRFRAEQA